MPSWVVVRLSVNCPRVVEAVNCVPSGRGAPFPSLACIHTLASDAPSAGMCRGIALKVSVIGTSAWRIGDAFSTGRNGVSSTGGSGVENVRWSRDIVASSPETSPVAAERAAAFRGIGVLVERIEITASRRIALITR
jgi:hypothetical protein